MFLNSLAYAQQLDAKDSLKSFRDRFIIPQRNGKDSIYFTGNSLGLQPQKAKEYIQAVLNQWANMGVDAYFKGDEAWMNYHDIMAPYFQQIVGAEKNEIVVMNQLTINLHLMMVSFYRPTPTRYKILCEAKAFPSDQYAFETHVKSRGLNPEDVIIEVAPREGEDLIREEDILAAINEHKDSLALVFIGGVNYYSGQLFNISAITKAAHEVGAFAGFDLAHAAGNVELKLHDWDVDFACWCTYKYLNSGPGSVGAVFIHNKYLKQKELNRFAGWWGYDKATRFLMDKGFKPIDTAEGWQLSIAPLLSMAVLRSSVEIYAEAGWQNLLEKSKKLTAFTHFVVRDLNEKAGIEKVKIITPSNEAERGCQVSLVILEKGRAVFDALTENGIVADWREPSVIRIAPVPLYNTYQEVYQFGTILSDVLS